MSSYHIAKDGKPQGALDENTIRQQIATGILNATDLCWCAGMTDWQPIGTVINLGQQADAPPPITNLTGATTSSPHQLTTFPVAVVILLHYVTFGIFTLVWLNLMHGKMSRVRPDDPSAGKGVGFCFIPFFNLYWIFFTYRRLCLRIDEQRDLYGLPPSNLRGLATANCIFQVIPYVNTFLGYTVITPIFIGTMQASVNELVRTSTTTVPQKTLPASALPARGMSGGAVAAIVCACIIPFIGLMAAIAIPSFLNARSRSQQSACMNNLRMIDAAIDQYKLDNTNAPPTAMTDLVPLYILRTPHCPASDPAATYDIAQPPTCPGHLPKHVLPP